MKQQDIPAIAANFHLPGPLVRVDGLGNGHINTTYCLTCQTDQGHVRTVLQRINQQVFKTPVQVIENCQRITEHIRTRLDCQNSPLAARQLTLIKTLNDQLYHTDAAGDVWRVYHYIERSVTLETIDSPALAFETARMFGWFLGLLTDLPGPPLYETIPDFHNTPKRLKAFLDILGKDPCNLAKTVTSEIRFVLKHADLCSRVQHDMDTGAIPVRITHNDTKINNVMMDQDTHQGVCVIDLDTVMPGSLLSDFGDMVRTATNPAEEDTQDLSQVGLRLDLFEGLVRGFVQETHHFLTPAEKKYLAFSGQLITFEQMIRFLTDHLAGNVYYKVHRDNHNLDRARTQMALVQSILAQEACMEALVDHVLRDLA